MNKFIYNLNRFDGNEAEMLEAHVCTVCLKENRFWKNYMYICACSCRFQVIVQPLYIRPINI